MAADCPKCKRLRKVADAAYTNATGARAANIARKAIAAHRATHGGDA